MFNTSWSWDAQVNHSVAAVLAEPADSLNWCQELEFLARDPLDGKILCVCAAAAVARAIVSTCPDSTPAASDALHLLAGWIDGPTVERFQRIYSLIFPPESSPEFDPYGVVGWALRTATSSTGKYEAGWALKSTCSAAMATGLSFDQLRTIAQQDLMSRMRPMDSD